MTPPVESRHWLWRWRRITLRWDIFYTTTAGKCWFNGGTRGEINLRPRRVLRLNFHQSGFIKLLQCCWCINAATTDGRDARRLWCFSSTKVIKTWEMSWIAACFLTSTLLMPAWPITAWSEIVEPNRKERPKVFEMLVCCRVRWYDTGVRKIKKWKGESRVMLAAVQWTTLFGL